MTRVGRLGSKGQGDLGRHENFQEKKNRVAKTFWAEFHKGCRNQVFELN
jgi:hypothetical protein